MKKVILFMVLFILGIVAVKAGIEVNGFETEKYNLGDNIKLTGFVGDWEGDYRNLEINSVCSNISRLVYLATVKPKEEFSVIIPAKDNMVGECYFKLSLKDDNGDVIEEKESGSFTVTKELRVEAETNVLSQKPGEEVIINGVIRKANGIRVAGGSVVLMLDNKIVYATGLSDGAFNYKVNLPLQLGSGVQSFEIKATDLEGNEGSGKAEIKILSIPEGLQIVLDKEVYRPGDRVVAKVLLNDQSGKNIVGSSTVRLYDPLSDQDMDRVVDNGNDFEIFLSSISLPGTWLLEAENRGLRTNKKFYVEEVKEKEIILEGNKLIIINTGNVDFEDPIQIDLKDENGEGYKLIKKTALKPNQTIVMDLSKEVPTGQYDVKVGGNKITGSVVVEGMNIKTLEKNSRYLGYGALVFVFLFLIVIVISKGRKRLSKREEAREKGREILSKRAFSRFSFRRRREENEEDIPKEVVNKIIEKKREKDKIMNARKDDIEYMLNRVKKKEESSSKKNPFDIFN